jgi:hypothetical protein
MRRKPCSRVGDAFPIRSLAGRGGSSRRRTAMRTTALLLALALPAAAWTASLSMHVEHAADATVVVASAELASDAATAWHVLTDYDRYAEFLPDVRACRVVSRRGSEVVVRQTGIATLWTLRTPVDVTYRITEEPPRALRSHATAAGMPAIDSVYALTPTAAGVRLDYRGHFGGVLERFAPGDAGVASVERHLRALAAEIERAAARRSQRSDAS